MKITTEGEKEIVNLSIIDVTWWEVFKERYPPCLHRANTFVLPVLIITGRFSLWRQEEENCRRDRRRSSRKLGDNYESNPWTRKCANAVERWILYCCCSWCCWGKRVSAFTYDELCFCEHWCTPFWFPERIVSSTTSALKDKHFLPSFLRDFLFYSPLRMLTIALYFKHALRKSHKDCERPLTRIDLARKNLLSAGTLIKIQLRVVCVCYIHPKLSFS